jgi:hypothetical protein
MSAPAGNLQARDAHLITDRLLAEQRLINGKTVHNAGSSTPSRLWFVDHRRLGRKEPNMMIIGVDYHPSFETIAFFIEETDGVVKGT